MNERSQDTTHIGTARFIKLTYDANEQCAALYQLDPPHYGHEFVEVSAVIAKFGPNAGRWETLIFPADEHGFVTSYEHALVGSYRGDCDHDKALDLAGYGVQP